jgi:hypothetical protein
MNKFSHSQEIITTVLAGANSLEGLARNKISNFIAGCFTCEGGFANRAGKPDLYYSLFGSACAFALETELDFKRLENWVHSFNYNDLGLIDLTSLIKILSTLEILGFDKALRANDLNNKLYKLILKFRTPSNGFSYTGDEPGFPYAAFLAINAFNDLGRNISKPENLAKSVKSCLKNDFSLARPESSAFGLLLSTAAGVLVYRQLTGEILNNSVDLIENYYSSGGFKADLKAALPDMLSTAVALFTLKVCKRDLGYYRKNLKQFVSDHWLKDGSFCATLLDESGDCEYVYYALLSLGAIKDV